MNAGPGEQRTLSQLIRNRCLPAVQPLGWKERLMDAWPVWGWVDQPEASGDLAAWVGACQDSFEAGWTATHAILDEIVAQNAQPTSAD
jgi:hypothetical protein